MNKFGLTFSATDALLRIDILNAFGPGGGLPVPGGDEIVDGVNELTIEAEAAGATIVDVQDWHPEGHKSFASTHGVAPFSTVQLSYGEQVAWTDHAVRGTHDADFMEQLVRHLTHLVIRKGYNPAVDSYSAFFENDRITKTGLAGYLRDKGIKRIILVGLAYDYCVGFSAIDGAKEGFEVVVLKPLTRAIATPLPDGRTSVDVVEAGFATAGITLITDTHAA